ncbi:MAG: hypothetical protein OXM61_00280 [Candidatus Poribacteria bacterium]|nr:hypothetical protein [Candidatus Poribacteria bacterium]
MFNQFFNFLFVFLISFMITGCSTIFSAQEWSDNYALMDGAQSTSPQMIDGNLETVGDAALTSDNTGFALLDKGEFARNDSIVVVSLPEKKKIYRIILHSENLRHFVVYVDKGKGTKDGNWQRIIEMRDVKSNIIDLKLKMPFYTHQIKIRILKTNPIVQKYGMSTRGSGRLDRTVFSNRIPIKLPGRIREIEIYGFKTAEQY